MWNYLPIFPGCLLLIRELRHMPPHRSLPGPLSQILPASCKSLSLTGLAFLSSLYILCKVTSLPACLSFVSLPERELCGRRGCHAPTVSAVPTGVSGTWYVFETVNKNWKAVCGLSSVAGTRGPWACVGWPRLWCSPRDPWGSGSMGAQLVRTKEELDEPLLKSRGVGLAGSGGHCSHSSFPQLLSSFLPVLRLSQKCSIQQDENHANYIMYASCSSLIPHRHDSHYNAVYLHLVVQ